jgi:two-component system LytT family response regulator
VNWRALIVDDEQASRVALRALLKRYCPTVEVIGEADSLAGAYKSILSHSPDVVFLDMRLKGGSGFELLDRFQRPLPFKVIFCTAFDFFALQAFRYGATDYLLKPLHPEELKDAVSRLDQPADYPTAEEQPVSTNVLNDVAGTPASNRIALSTIDGVIVLNYTEIIRLESDSNYTEVHLDSRERILTSKTLKDFERMLPNRLFFRTHQSHMVQINHVKRFVKEGGGTIILNDGSEICLARRRKDDFLRWLTGSFND